MSKCFKIRGIVEGFYGRPWSWEERKDMLVFAGKNGYNLYIYAPKADTYHRHDWREMYPDTFLNAFSDLIKTGNKNNMDVAMAVSPGLSLVYSSEEEMETLVKKFEIFITLGTKTCALFLDDIPWKLQHDPDIEKYEDLADAQQDFTNRLYKRLKEIDSDISLIFCPTEYYGTKPNEYRQKIGKTINQEVEIMWTGPWVCAKELKIEDTKAVSEEYQRPLLFWDNYPVNDASMVSEMHIGPYTGRENNLNCVSSGIVINPMNQPYASMIPMKAIGRYLMDCTDYNAEEVLESVVKEDLAECSEEFINFINANLRSHLHPEDPERSVAFVDNLKENLKSWNFDKLSKILSEESKTIENDYLKINKHLSEDLRADLKDWLEEYRNYAPIYQHLAVIYSNIGEYYHTGEMKSETIRLFKKSVEDLETVMKVVAFHKTRVFGTCIRNYVLDYLVTAKGIVSLLDY